ncbi:MAG TPA: lactate utilization protein [Bryobacteraceae bacterium]|nr:lactate utilization protein [Bryobacteraceae bacterium]
MTARDEVLNNIRTALGRAAGQLPAPLAAPALRIPLSDRNLYTDLFVKKLENLSGKTIVVREPADVVPALAGILDGKRAVASNAPFLETCGITRLPEVQSGFTDGQALRTVCVEADIGITSADYALAETGTFVMISSPKEARLVSLLPPVHIAVFPRARILANLDELLGVLPLPAEQTSSMVLITGGSRTADIEQILIRGVHGPGEVLAVIVENG